MKAFLKKAWATVGITGLIAIGLFGHLLYMNLRPADPILAGWQPYEAASFNETLQNGDPMLVEIYASWCPTCKAQHEAFETMVDNGTAPNIRAVRVDYDDDPAFLKRYGIRGTGILMLFDDGREIARAAGLTTPKRIQAFISQHDLDKS
ncbi:thioredoxin family protein [Yunchengibacter salinarum]|uniref:thioredoxin family protein n=1 Tax=Yunchengibacter salinarum TaxID=3133399 RepID=UPI0035B5C8CF